MTGDDHAAMAKVKRTSSIEDIIDEANDNCSVVLQSTFQAVIPGEQFPGRWSLLEMFTQKLRCLPGPNGKGAYTTSDDVMNGVDLTGKTYLVTGANSGLGLETMIQLVKAGACVLGTARTEGKLHQAFAADDSLTTAF